jgi:hypothetical protein
MDTLEDAVQSESIARVRDVLSRPGGVPQSELDYALIVTAGNSTLDIATLLLARGASVNGGGGFDDNDDNEEAHAFYPNPLHQAVLHCNVPLANLLIARGADIDRLCNDRSALSLAASSVDHFPVLKALLVAGADPNVTGKHFAPLNIAVLAQNKPALTALLARHANPNFQAPPAPSALDMAAMLSLPTFVHALLAAGAYPGLSLHHPFASPLQCAVHAEEFGAEGVFVVCMLLRAGAHPTEHGTSGPRPLLVATDRAESLPPEDDRMRAALGTAAAMLIAAGDTKELDTLPTPWPDLRAALPAVWQTTPEALPEIFNRMESWAQEGVRCLLRMSHRYGLPKELRWRLAGEVLGDAGRDLGLY